MMGYPTHFWFKHPYPHDFAARVYSVEEVLKMIDTAMIKCPDCGEPYPIAMHGRGLAPCPCHQRNLDEALRLADIYRDVKPPYKAFCVDCEHGLPCNLHHVKKPEQWNGEQP